MNCEYGLLGYPLGHSFSRAYFNNKFATEGIDAEYLNFELQSVEELPQLLAEHPRLRGLNVTIPHKQAVIPLLDELSDEARAIGAVNVIRIERQESGSAKPYLKGFNSDVIGFVESIRPLLQPHHTRALVLGTGGASKAVCRGLEKLGIEWRYVSRKRQTATPAPDSPITAPSASPKSPITVPSASPDSPITAPSASPNNPITVPSASPEGPLTPTAPAPDSPITVPSASPKSPITVPSGSPEGPLTYSDLTPSFIADYTVIVNCTPLGMFPRIDSSPELPYAALSKHHLLFDLVYNPGITQFMRQGRRFGATVKNGLEMLHLQADASWDFWNGKD